MNMSINPFKGDFVTTRQLTSQKYVQESLAEKSLEVDKEIQQGSKEAVLND